MDARFSSPPPNASWTVYTSEANFPRESPVYANYSGDADMRARSQMEDAILGQGGFGGYESPSKDAEHALQRASTLSPGLPRQTLRRAVSTGALPTPSNISSIYTFHDPPTPTYSSPASDALNTPRDGQPMPAGSSWFAAEQEHFLSHQAQLPPQEREHLAPHLHQPTALPAFSASPTYYPTSPVASPRHAPLGTDELPRRRRPSLHPRSPNQASTTASGSGSRYHPARNLSITVPPSSAFNNGPYSAPPAVSQQMPHTPSVEEVNQFFADMGDILGPETMAALSPKPLMRTIPPSSQRAQSPSYYPPPHSPYGKTALHNVSGVLLEAEDLAMLDQPHSRSNSPLAYPEAYSIPGRGPTYRSSPLSAYFAQLNNRNLLSNPAPPPKVDQQPFYYASPYDQNQQQQSLHHPQPQQPQGQLHQSHFPPQPPYSRPRSAPASPELGGGGFGFQSNSYQNYPSSNSSSYPPPQSEHRRRRGSSVDGFLMNARYAAPGPPPDQQQQQQAYRSHHAQQPRYQQQQQEHQHQQHSPQRDPYGREQQHQGGQPMPTTPTRKARPAALSTPGRRTPAGSPKVVKKQTSPVKAGPPMFINFTATDATALLNGVAPSGSSKRKREEEEEAERCKRMGM